MTPKHAALTFVNRLIRPGRVSLVRTDQLPDLAARERRRAWQDNMTRRLLALAPERETIPRAQIGQDLFALWATSFMREGFFVEVGAADGIRFSNTFLLEQSFSWTGIVAEPATVWHKALATNRQCAIDTRCVWSQSGTHVAFAQPSNALLSTVADYTDRDHHHALRAQARTYPVETVTLNDLLKAHSAPRRIDFLSVDTEGTELEILRGFDFERYRVTALCVEHNNDSQKRRDLHDLLQANEFSRVLTEISAIDDWYLRRPLAKEAPLLARRAA